MLRPTIVIVALAAVAVALAMTIPSAPAQLQPSAAATYQGKTAMQWHALAVSRRIERDRARSKAGEAIRHSRQLGRSLHQLSRMIGHSPHMLAPPVRAIARAEAARLGITGLSWDCLESLISRENGNAPEAWNPAQWNGSGSGAYGLPQALPGSKMESEGSDWFWNPATQIRWMAGYVERYGGACGADAFQRAHGYY